MKTLYFLIGISGSGKSTWAKSIMNTTLICPDDIRKEITGDISNQSQNTKVFEIAYARSITLMKENKTIIFDSTGMHKEGRIHLCKIAKNHNYKISCVIFNDSKDIDLCRNRVKQDINNGIERSNTIINNSIHTRQHSSFLNTIEEIKNEHWNEYIYIGGKP
jgi:predicted kinase